MINVFHIVSNKIWSGPEQYAFDLACMLKDDPGYYVEIVCRKSDSVFSKFRTLEVPVSMLPLKGFHDFESPVRFSRLLKRGHNIIHVHSFRDAVVAIWAKHIAENPKNRIVFTLHGVPHPRLNYVSKKVYREVDRVIFVSQKAYNEFIPRIQRFDSDKAVIIRDSVLPATNEQMQGAPDLRRICQMTDEQAMIMFHGRLSHEKGIDLLLQALSRMDGSKYHLVVIGEGQRKFVSQIKGFIVSHNMVKNVTFLGFSGNVQPLIKQCRFGVLPSIMPEALGLSNLEYMMQGKAHITTNNGAQPEYINNGENGLLVNPGSEKELATAIHTLLSDSVLCSRLGMQAQRDFNERLNYQNFYQEMTKLYSGLYQ